MERTTMRIIKGKKKGFIGAMYDSLIIMKTSTDEEIESFIKTVASNTKFAMTIRDVIDARVHTLRALIIAGAKVRNTIKKMITGINRDIDEQVANRRLYPTDSIQYAWYDVSVEDLIYYKNKLALLLNTKKTIESRNAVSEEEIERARQYPITSILEFKNLFRKCDFHNKDEKIPSLKYYPEKNSVYCFGCHTYADSIALYRFVYNVDFVTAVKQLNK